jgi:hypothetical protein
MKKLLFFTVLTLTAVFLSGCSSTPKPVKQRALFEDMQKMSNEILKSGGLAVVGIGESRSLELALNKAKTNGRRELAQMLTVKVESLEKAFMDETGTPEDAEIMSQFTTTTKVITSQQLAGSVAQELKYEVIGTTVTAYALMVLDPQTIADQLAKEKELYTRLQSTKAFDELDKEIKEYEAWKASQNM